MRSARPAHGLLLVSIALTIGAGAAALDLSGLQNWRAEQTLAEVPLQTAPPSSGLSPREHNDLLADCHQNMESLSGLLMAPQDRLRMVESCDRIARDIIAASPKTSYAWFVAALVEEERLEPREMIDDLVQSQALAPRSAALAYYRGQKLLANLDQLGENGRTALLSDIAAMATASRGLDWLARSYLRRPEYKETIASGIDAAGPEISRRFLSALTRLSR